jgi:tetratricopeptide (TPR) repeat protein
VNEIAFSQYVRSSETRLFCHLAVRLFLVSTLNVSCFMKTLDLLLACAIGLGLPVAAADTDFLGDALRRGLVEEEVNENLGAAIEHYQWVVRAYERNRPSAAAAVFRLAECYRRLGQTNQAVLYYRRVVKEFADVAELLAPAQAQLVAMERESPVEEALPADAALERQKELLRQEVQVAELQLTVAKRRFDAGSGPQSDVFAAQREFLALQRELVALDVRRGVPGRVQEASGDQALHLSDQDTEAVLDGQ